MISPDTEQVFLLSDYFHSAAKAIEAYIDRQVEVLSNEERNNLCDSQIELLQLSGEMNMYGTTLVFNDVKESLQKLDAITTEVHKAVKKALAVQTAINVAASLVSLGTAILSKDPKAISTKIYEVAGAIGIKK